MITDVGGFIKTLPFPNKHANIVQMLPLLLLLYQLAMYNVK